MKRMTIGLVAAAFAIVGFAFTTTSAKKTGCTGNYIWYTVPAGNGNLSFTVGSPADISLLTTTLYSDVNSDGLITSADFTGRVVSEPSAESTYSCPDVGAFKCAIAFDVDASPSGEFEIVSGVVKPKVNFGTFISQQNVACIIKRTTN